MELKTALRILFKKRRLPTLRAIDKFLLEVMKRGKAVWYPHCYDIIELELDGRKFNLRFDPMEPWNGCSSCRWEQEDSFDSGDIHYTLLWDSYLPSRRVLLRFCVWLEHQGIDKFKSPEVRAAAHFERVLAEMTENDD